MAASDEEVVDQIGTSRKGKRRILIAGLAAILVLGGAGGAFLGLSGSGTPARARATKEAAGIPVLVDVPDIISNLDTAGHRATFVKMHAKIQVGSEAAAKLIGAGMPRVLDLFQTYLRSMRPDELKGGEGLYRLREALIYRLDAAFAPVVIGDVLFTELLVQ